MEGKGRGLSGRLSEEDKLEDIANLLDRSAADIRGRKYDDVKMLEKDETHKKTIEERENERKLKSAHVREAEI